MTKQKHFFLIRGLIREARHWGEIPSLLKETSPGCKVTMIDIPGAGIYSDSPSPLSIRKMVEEMRRVYTAEVSPNEEKILVAISLGGMISGQWLKQHESDFDKVVMINTSYGGISPMFDRLKPMALFHLFKVPVLKGRDKEARILRLVTNHNQIFDKTLDLWEFIQKERPVSLFNTVKQLTAAAMFRIGDYRPKIPVLILAAVQDRMVSVECSRAIAKAWNAPITEHPTAGHDLSADDPKWVVKEVVKFSE
jgi:pimeloyl-[acyl-carrier protein] methyl ester esterase